MFAFATSTTAEAINFFIGLIGLVVGVGGFWITLAQISQVKSVSAAQKEAIKDLKFRLAGFDAIQECAQAQIYLEALRDAVQSRDKASIIASYDRLALSMLSLSESTSISHDLSDLLRESSNRVAVLSSGIDKTAPSDISVSKQLETSRTFHAVLMRVRFYIHKEQ